MAEMDKNPSANGCLNTRRTNETNTDDVASGILLQNAFQVLDDTNKEQNGVATGDVFSDSQCDQNSQWSVVQNTNNKKRKFRISDDNGNKGIPMSSAEYSDLSMNDKLLVMYNKIDAQCDFMSKIDSKIDLCLQLHNKVDAIDSKLSEQDARLSLLEYKSIDQEARSRRKKLVFYGFAEEQFENCSLKIKSFLAEKLEITQPIAMDRAHRIGRFRRGGNRGIVVAFKDFLDLQLILSRAYKLKNTNFSINRDFPSEITNAR